MGYKSQYFSWGKKNQIEIEKLSQSINETTLLINELEQFLFTPLISTRVYKNKRKCYETLLNKGLGNYFTTNFYNFEKASLVRELISVLDKGISSKYCKYDFEIIRLEGELAKYLTSFEKSFIESNTYYLPDVEELEFYLCTKISNPVCNAEAFKLLSESKSKKGVSIKVLAFLRKSKYEILRDIRLFLRHLIQNFFIKIIDEFDVNSFFQIDLKKLLNHSINLKHEFTGNNYSITRYYRQLSFI